MTSVESMISTWYRSHSILKRDNIQEQDTYGDLKL